MSWFRNIRPRRRSIFAAVGALVLAGAVRARAQDVEQRYQEAVALFNKPDMESACDAFQKIPPDYKQTTSYMNRACNETKRMLDMEKRYFDEGVDLYNQGHYDEARDKFSRSGKIPLKNPKFRQQIMRFLKDMDARQNEERSLQAAMALFNQGKLDEARAAFTSIAQGNGPKAAEANNYLGKIAEMVSKKRAAEAAVADKINEGQRLAGEGKYAEARSALKPLISPGGAGAEQARNVISQIEGAEAQAIADARRLSKQGREEEARNLLNRVAMDSGGTRAEEARRLIAQLASGPVKAPPAANEEKPAAVTREPQAAGDQVLRNGLQAFFEGRLDEAERQLSDYLAGNGTKQDLAYFFRGAAYGTAYFLSGEKDSNQKDLALGDFRTVGKHGGRFSPPEKLVSPKILALYAQASGQ